MILLTPYIFSSNIFLPKVSAYINLSFDYYIYQFFFIFSFRLFHGPWSWAQSQENKTVSSLLDLVPPLHKYCNICDKHLCENCAEKHKCVHALEIKKVNLRKDLEELKKSIIINIKISIPEIDNGYWQTWRKPTQRNINRHQQTEIRSWWKRLQTLCCPR